MKPKKYTAHELQQWVALGADVSGDALPGPYLLSLSHSPDGEWEKQPTAAFTISENHDGRKNIIHQDHQKKKTILSSNTDDPTDIHHDYGEFDINHGRLEERERQIRTCM